MSTPLRSPGSMAKAKYPGRDDERRRSAYARGVRDARRELARAALAIQDGEAAPADLLALRHALRADSTASD